jgi:hypothetical protein
VIHLGVFACELHWAVSSPIRFPSVVKSSTRNIRRQESCRGKRARRAAPEALRHRSVASLRVSAGAGWLSLQYTSAF